MEKQMFTLQQNSGLNDRKFPLDKRELLFELVKLGFNRKVLNERSLEEFEKNLNQVIWFFSERISIAYKKSVLRLDPPWTEDEILQKYKICNVIRALDTGTRLLIEAVNSSEDKNPSHVFFYITLYRVINARWFFLAVPRVETLIENYDECAKRLAQQETLSQRLYGINYTRPLLLKKGVRYLTEYYKEFVPWFLSFDNFSVRGVRKFFFDTLPKVKPTFIGEFILFQILFDLSYFKIGTIDADDLGGVFPGAISGLLFLAFRDIDKLKNYSYAREFVTNSLALVGALYLLRDILEISFSPSTREMMVKLGVNKLTVGDVEHGLCEYRKWVFAREKGVRPVRLYKPETGGQIKWYVL